jgi:hypothetical protein
VAGSSGRAKALTVRERRHQLCDAVHIPPSLSRVMLCLV